MSTAITYRLLLVQPSVVFAARVNQATIPADAASVMYDGVTTGAYTDIRSEMLVCFGTSAGADDLGRARVRKDATADTLYIGWVSRGKGEGEAILLDNAYITVLDLYKPWTKNPRIDTDGVQYLDYDRDFATYSASPPIVNLDCGTAVQRDLDPDTELATFEFSAIHTYMTDPDAAAMYTDWLWELPPKRRSRVARWTRTRLPSRCPLARGGCLPTRRPARARWACGACCASQGSRTAR